jgi:hypothetical protein
MSRSSKNKLSPSGNTPQPPRRRETAEPKVAGEVVLVALSLTSSGTGGHTMQQRLHWLDYDPVAFAVLAVGMGMIALLALSI